MKRAKTTKLKKETLSLDEAAERIVNIVEEYTSQFAPSEREARLRAFDDALSKSSPQRDSKARQPHETEASRPLHRRRA